VASRALSEPRTQTLLRARSARWAEFKKRYSAELADRSELLAPILAASASESDTVTLVYSARDEAHNRAVVFAEYLPSAKRAKDAP